MYNSLPAEGQVPLTDRMWAIAILGRICQCSESCR